MSILETMTHERWSAMTAAEKDAARDLSQLNAQLTPYIGWRVEVVTDYGETRRFIVGKSTGWQPIYLELHNRRSIGGFSTERHYASVRPLYRAH